MDKRSHSRPPTVRQLLAGNADEELDDRVFWYADTVRVAGDGLELRVDNVDGIVASPPLDRTLGVKSLRDLARRSHAPDWDAGFGPVLVSSGTFLFIDGRLAVTRRTDDAEVDPGLWTGPAGRCDRTPYVTALKETAEEIEIRDAEGRRWVPTPAMPFVSDTAGVVAFPVAERSATIPLRTTAVRLFVNGEAVAEHALWYFFDDVCNTLELRLPLFAQSDGHLSLSNPEYDTPARLCTLAELRGLPAVAAVRQLIKEIEDGRSRS